MSNQAYQEKYLSERLIGYINNYKISFAIFIASEIGLFELLRNSITIKNLSDALKTHNSATTILLNIFIGIGLVEKNDVYYSLTADAKKLLTKDSHTSLIPLIDFESYLAFNSLNTGALKLGLLGHGIDNLNQNGKSGLENLYGKVMDNGGRFAALCVSRIFPSNFEGRILDLGGGIGTFAVQLSKLNNKIVVDVFDKEEMRNFCEKNIRINQMEQKVNFYTRDIINELPDKTYQAVLISNVLHLFDRETVKNILKNSIDSLQNGGMLVLHDFFLDNTKTGPYIPLLYTLDWMALGANFNASFQDIIEWVTPHGVGNLEMKTFRQIPTSIIFGTKG